MFLRLAVDFVAGSAFGAGMGVAYLLLRAAVNGTGIVATVGGGSGLVCLAAIVAGVLFAAQQSEGR